MSDIIFNSCQEKALKGIKEIYLHDKKKPYITLAGWAGTGKSTLISFMLEDFGIKDKTISCSLTGKAASVLSLKGVSAMTIHKLIYNVEPNGNGGVTFYKKERLDEDYRMIIVDEGSMVNTQLWEDLLSFGILIVVVGDPGQLPAIGDSPNLLQKPDFLLSDIVRQAKDSPIIMLSKYIREGGKLKRGSMGSEIHILDKCELPDHIYHRADQVIVGTNTSRDRVNKFMRYDLGKFSDLPEVGDKIICTKNNMEVFIDAVPLFNGMLGTVRSIKAIADTDTHMIDFQPDFSEHSRIFMCNTSNFVGKPFKESRNERFDFGYAITCHKSQGSEFSKVLVLIDQMYKTNMTRWTYTAVTRAKDRLVIGI